MKRLGVCFLILAVACSTLRADDAATKATVQKLAGELTGATVKGDYGKMIDLTYPGAVTAMGGREKAIETIGSLMTQVKSQGFQIKSMEAGTAGDLVVDNKTIYVVVPTKTEMTFPQGTIKINSYFLGISPDSGANWSFVDGGGMENKEFLSVLPKLPEALKLPAAQKPEVVPNPAK